MSLVDAHKLFHDVFGASLNPFLDGYLMTVFQKPIIDIKRFDDWLHKKFGEYENEGMSMTDVLVKNYGKTVNSQIEDLLGIN